MSKIQAIISINGNEPPAEPMSMTITKSDLYSDSSRRTAEQGILLLYPIRYNVYSIELEYLLDSQQAKELENLVSGSELSVQFRDGDDIKTCSMYPSDRTKRLVGTAESRKYDISFSLTEL